MANTDDLDKMLDDLKTTVHTDNDRSTAYQGEGSLASSFRTQYLERPESFVDIFRSSSRNESRNSSRGIEDSGLMRHQHKEYTSPDKSTRIITDEFEYDTGDPSQVGQFQKKVKKSTYSTYKVSGGISDDLDSLRQGPTPAVMSSATADSEVVSASQKVANKLVHALSSIGVDPVNTNTLATNSDYSTLTRLDKDITDLDSILEKIETEERAKKATETRYRTHEVTRTQPTNQIIHIEQNKTTNTKRSKHSHDDQDVHFVSPSSKLPNSNQHSKYEDDMDIVDDGQGGDVRRIVWRNRFEKTSESQDTTTPKVLTIEEDALRRMRKQETHSSSTSRSLRPMPPQRLIPRGPVSPRHLQLQYAIYWPNSPNISPGGESWADPVPLPTPPQLSPGEPGVAYMYTYAQDAGSKVQHLPPLNYVAAPPTSDGAPSPTPSGVGQPIIYHYSYHYTLQPGQQIPDGAHHPPGVASSNQPALQFAPQPRHHTPTSTLTQSNPPSAAYNYQSLSSHTSNVNRSDNTHSYAPPTPTSPATSGPISFPTDHDDASPLVPRRGEPKTPTDGPNSNMSITINKTTTHTTHTKEFGGPNTSTPAPDRYYRSPGSPGSNGGPGGPYGPGGPGGPGSITTNYTTRTTHHNDSLDRLKRPYQESLAFPDTSPIKPTGENTIPRKVDDLMTSLDSQEGVDPGFRRPYPSNGTVHPVESKPLLTREKSEEGELVLDSTIKREDSKNLAGPPVYYPPGHQHLFDESMHTMTLKENKRRGQAKWRRERAASAKESSSESKGGMAMVPVCLPLCCGAACVVM